MTQKKMLVLAVLFIGVLSYIFMYEIPKTKEKETADKIFGTASEINIQSIEIKKGDRTVSLINKKYEAGQPASDEEKKETKKGEWELAMLQGVPLDGSTIQAIVSPLLSLKYENPIPAEEKDSDISVYGLQSPEMVLGVKHSGGDLELRLGKKNDYVFKRYFQVGGKDSIYLSSDALYSAADKSEKDFRKKDVVSFPDYEAKKATLIKGSEKLVFEKNPDEHWRIAEPIKATASDEKLRGLFRELRDMKASDFIDFAANEADSVLKTYRLDAPDFTASIEKTSGDPVVIIASDLADPADSSKTMTVFRVGNYPFLGKTGTSILGRISMSPEEYRERKLFSWGNDVVKKAVIERPGQETLTLNLEKDVWKLEGKDADQVFVEQFFKNLSDLSAAAFPTPGQSVNFGFDQPQLKITIATARYGSDEKPQEKTLVIGAETEAGAYAASGDLSEPFLIDKDSLKKISPAKEQLIPPPAAAGATTVGEAGKQDNAGQP